MKLEHRLQAIEMILCDVDGVLTDGGITFDNQGVESKTFFIRDGLGIRVWQRVGHKFGMLTARSSHVVKVRATELGVDLIRQGSEDKWPVARQMIEQSGFPLAAVCYIGDDLTDLQVMKQVGLAVAVQDAAEEVKVCAQYVTRAAGGRGAVREVIEMILKAQQRWDEVVRKYMGS